MFVEASGKLLRCRCPAPTKIGNLNFQQIPCLLSKNTDEHKTSHTVEAIYIAEHDKTGFWVGINQTRINAVCEYFINQDAFSRLVKDIEFRRDVKYGDSRLDFASEDVLLEVKTPLTVLPTKNRDAFFSNYAHSGDYERTIKHYKTLARFARTGKRAIVLLAYMYPAPPFDPIKQNGNNGCLLKAFYLAQKSGVEFWQANFTIDKHGMELTRYFKLGGTKNHEKTQSKR